MHDAEMRHILLKDKQARLLACSAPSISAIHASEFKRGVVKTVTFGVDAVLTPSRATLWANPPESAQDAKGTGHCLPEWYALTNSLCQVCNVPLIPGQTAMHCTSASTRRRSKHRRIYSGVQLKTVCSVCQTIQDTLPFPISRGQFPNTRRRAKDYAKILAGNADSLNLPSSTRMSKTDGLPNTASLDTKPSNQALPPTKSETPTLAPAASRAVPMTLDTKGKSIASQHMQRPTKQRAVDSKANLRVMLQEKKQGNQRDKKGDSSSGLADFLSQL